MIAWNSKVLGKPEDCILKLLDLTTELPLEAVLQDTHAGTHIEAPAYLIPNGKKLDQFALDSFMVQAVLLDLTSKKAGQPIDDEDLEGAEESAGLALREGEAVVLHTGWGDSAGTTAIGSHGYLSENGAEFLEFKRPSMVATDAPSLDAQDDKALRAHSTLMRAEILVLENLRNLDKVQESRFRLVAFPLRVNGPISPVRAVAVVEG